MTKISTSDANEVMHGRRKIKSHLGMRGVAASAVVMYHIGFVVGFHFNFERRDFIFGRSYLAVDLFFILSGFIISYVNKADRSIAMTWREAANFMKNRFARIYPLHFVCLYALVLCSLIISIAGSIRGKQAFSQYWPTNHIMALIAQTALVQSLGPVNWIDWNVPSWSISAEIFAYISFVLLVNIQTRSSLAQLFALIIIPLIFYYYVYHIGGSLDIITGIAPLRCLAGFSLGMLTFYFKEKLRYLPDIVINAVQIVSVAVVLCDLALNWNDLIAVPAFTMLVYATWSDRGMLSKVLATRPAQHLGDISYSIYLTHVPVIFALTLISDEFANNQPWFSVEIDHAIFICCTLTAVYISSRLTYRYIETAGRDWVLQLFHSERKLPARVPGATG